MPLGCTVWQEPMWTTRLRLCRRRCRLLRRRDDAEEEKYYLQEAENAGDDSVLSEGGRDYVFGEGSLDFGADEFSEALASI